MSYGIKLEQTNLTILAPETSEKKGWDRSVVWDYVQLRDACRCPLCVDPHSKQRRFRTTDIPLNILPRSTQLNGQKLVVRWSNDIPGFDELHTSAYDLEFLRLPVPEIVGPASRLRKRYGWSKHQMERQQHWVSFDDYMTHEVKFMHAMRQLARSGIIFLKGIPESRDMVERIATRMGPLRNTFYGLTWDVRTISEAKNIAYTSQPLDLHMDLLYTNDPPGYQVLHCLKNSCDGGGSLFADTFSAAHDLHQDFPDLFNFLREFRANYHYVHEDQVYQKSWPVIEAKDIGTKDLRISHVNFSPPFQAPFFDNPSRDGGRKDWSLRFRKFVTALHSFTRYLDNDQSVFELKLQPGDCVIFENRRIAHGRRAFDPTMGERWLAGAYVDEDAVRSTFTALRQQNQHRWSFERRPGTAIRYVEDGAQ